MSHRSQNAKIHPLAVAMAKAGVRPRAQRRAQGIIIRFPVERRTDAITPEPAPAAAAPSDTPLIALSPFRHAPAAAAALIAGFALVALVLRVLF
jgi:hypothetical protein